MSGASSQTGMPIRAAIFALRVALVSCAAYTGTIYASNGISTNACPTGSTAATQSECGAAAAAVDSTGGTTEYTELLALFTAQGQTGWGGERRRAPHAPCPTSHVPSGPRLCPRVID